MAVTKLPRTRKGTISQGPPLSWPNDTAIGRRRPNLGLLRQATHNRQQRRLSTLPATSKQNVPRPVQHSAVRSQASKASGYPRYKTHKRIHHPAQQPTASRFSGKAPKQNKGLAPHSTQLRKHSKLSRNSLIDEKEDAKSQKDSHISTSSPPSPLTSNTLQTNNPPSSIRQRHRLARLPPRQSPPPQKDPHLGPRPPPLPPHRRSRRQRTHGLLRQRGKVRRPPPIREHPVRARLAGRQAVRARVRHGFAMGKESGKGGLGERA